MRTIRSITFGVIVGIIYQIGGAYLQAMIMPNPVAFDIFVKFVERKF